MTESDWLTGTDFAEHARFADETLSARRRRLLAVAFCRAAGDLIDHPELLDALAVTERYADGRATPADIERVRHRCRVVAQEAFDTYATHVDRGLIDQFRPSPGVGRHVLSELAWAVAYAAGAVVEAAAVGGRVAAAAVEARTGVVLMVPVPGAEFDRATAAQAALMRSVVWEVAGNPFRAIDFGPWRTDTAVLLAKQMYESREFGAMPILADALQDAGCDADDVLRHCREGERHVRGCWVVDSVLGKG
jgi:hypothetical protein